MEDVGTCGGGLRGDGEREAFGAASPAVRETGVAAYPSTGIDPLSILGIPTGAARTLGCDG